MWEKTNDAATSHRIRRNNVTPAPVLGDMKDPSVADSGGWINGESNIESLEGKPLEVYPIHLYLTFVTETVLQCFL